jgi:predicted nucleotidyltransferase
LPVGKVFLYGSYANGTVTVLSDVDVCFFISNLNDDNWIDAMVKLSMLLLDYNLFISPIIFNNSDIYVGNTFIKEVLRTGIKIN